MQNKSDVAIVKEGERRQDQIEMMTVEGAPVKSVDANITLFPFEARNSKEHRIVLVPANPYELLKDVLQKAIARAIQTKTT